MLPLRIFALLAVLIAIIAMGNSFVAPPSRQPVRETADEAPFLSFRLPFSERWLPESVSGISGGENNGTSSPPPSPSPSRDVVTPTDIAPNRLYLPEQKSTTLDTGIRAIRAYLIHNAVEDRGGDLVLRETDAYTIIYTPALDAFIVFIREEPVQEVKEDAEAWFRSFNLQQSDLCRFPVRFLLWSIPLRQANPDFSSMPTRCPAPY